MAPTDRMWQKGVGLVERLRAYYFGKKGVSSS